ncbi:MAG: bacteriohemerythrin [Desulfuromonadales bacterium]|nr:bacteriohemerythrin [Desulfuromonadales bacterium]MBN2791526.1 bacteriohemerythrin [Desulfuromonadales bacterium]
MFDNLKIGKKMLLLSGSILLLLAATVIWAAIGLSGTLNKGTQAAFGNKLSSTLSHMEIKHDGWNNKVRNFLDDPEHHELNVKTDFKTCTLGTWYYGEERIKAEQRLPEIKEELAALEAPHSAMHLSAKKIKDAYRPADPTLPDVLENIEKDLFSWVSAVQNALLSHHKQINANADPEQSLLGQFFTSEQAQKAAQRNPEFAEILSEIKAPHANLHNLVNTMNEALNGADRRTLYSLYDDELLPTLAEVRYQIRSLKRIADKELEGWRTAKEIYRTETQPNLAQLKTHLRNIAKKVEASVISDEAMISAAQNTRNGIITVGIVAMLLGIALAIFISRSLTAPMKKAVSMLDDLENGHLDTRLNMARRDEIGQMAETMDRFADSLQDEVVDALQRLANGDLTFDIHPRDGRDVLRGSLQKLGVDLNQILQQIQTASEQIDSGSSQVSESAQALSDGAAQSAASVEEISSSMNEIGSQTNTSSEYAQQANQLASSARTSADRGSERMAEMINAMGEINEAGQNINKIIKVIDEIAFQTNLLALNAAVEAARAGQHGKGFAVVAEEVRNLAARSAKAASETAELIEGSVEKAGNGTQIAERTAEALDEIVASISKVSDLVGEIAASSNEQAQGIAQVNIGMQQIDQVIQQNTANAEESAATSEELSSQAAELKHQLSRFKLKGSYAQSFSPASTEQLSLPPQSSSGSGWNAMANHPPQQHTASPLLKWKDEFNTGVTLMDQQHKRLVELINQLFQCMKDGGDRMLLAEVVDELVNYTVTHFRAEEDVMKKHNYPDLEAHKLVHKNFVDKVAVYAEKLKAGDRLPPAEVYGFLKDWLVSHIEKQDRDGYGRHIAA